LTPFDQYLHITIGKAEDLKDFCYSPHTVKVIRGGFRVGFVFLAEEKKGLFGPDSLIDSPDGGDPMGK
jgi:hypothetical protein